MLPENLPFTKHTTVDNKEGQFLANTRYTVGELFTITRTKFIQFNLSK